MYDFVVVKLVLHDSLDGFNNWSKHNFIEITIFTQTKLTDTLRFGSMPKQSVSARQLY